MGIKYSVIIPSYNRKQQLLLTLSSFEQQTYPQNRYEVLVIDDGSTDGTAEALAVYHPPYLFSYKRIKVSRGPAGARNLGVQRARGKYLIFCDPDFLVLPHFIERLAYYHTHNKKAIVSGTPGCFQGIFTHYYPDFSNLEKKVCQTVLQKSGLWKESYLQADKIIEIITPEDIRQQNYSKLKQVLSDNQEFSKEMKREYSKTDVAPWVLFITRCLSVKKKYVQKVGGFDEQFPRGEDWELGYRLHQQGLTFVSLEERLGFHQEHPATYRLNENKAYLYQKHGLDDPALTLLSVWYAWHDVRLYKNTLRTIEKYKHKDQAHRDFIYLLQKSCRNAVRSKYQV